MPLTSRVAFEQLEVRFNPLKSAKKLIICFLFLFLSFSKTQLLVAANNEKEKESGVVEAAGPLLRYLAELMTALKYSSEKECPPSPSLCTGDGDSLIPEVDSDWMDDMGGEDEDSGGEESVSGSFCI